VSKGTSCPPGLDEVNRNQNGLQRLPEHRGTVKMELLCSQASQILAGELHEVAGKQAPQFIHVPWGYRCALTSAKAIVTEPGSAVDLRTAD